MRMSMKWVVASCALVLAQASSAQTATVFSEQGQLTRANQNVTALGSDLMGDRVNLYTGGLELVQTDVSLPGNFALPVSVGRRYVTGPHRGGQDRGSFIDWDLEIPHLHGVYAGPPAQMKGWTVDVGTGNASPERCSKFGAPPLAGKAGTTSEWAPDQFWGGHFLYIPGAGDQKMLKRAASYTSAPTDGQTYNIVTTSNWQFRCLTSGVKVNGVVTAGEEGFVAVSPDGSQYRFDWIVSRWNVPLTTGSGTLQRTEVWILPTLVTDRFGNTVSYTYDLAQPWNLTRILASDGRKLTLTYYAGTKRVNTVNATATGYATRTWTYNYSTTYPNALTSVVLPDASQWLLSMAEQTLDKPVFNPKQGCQGSPQTWRDGVVTSAPLTSIVTHPSGAVATFVVDWVMHGRSNVAGSNPSCPMSDLADDIVTPVWASRTIKSKTISGPGVPASTWTYLWGPPNGSWVCTGSCPVTKTLVVQAPDYNATTAKDRQTRYTFGNKYISTEGQRLRIESGWDGTVAAQTTVNTYRAKGAGPYAATVGWSGREDGNDIMENSFLPLGKREITQQGVTFTWEATLFDTLARVTGQSRYSTLYPAKTETTAYSDNTTKWVMGQVLNKTVGGTTTESTVYDPITALPTSKSLFGKLQASFTYTLLPDGVNTDGTLYTVKDGLNQITKYINYKRGLAQTITYADTKTQSAEVDDFGLIRSLTNEVNQTTGYGYDIIGRLSSITYPTGDAVAYNDTTLAFERVTSSEVGLPANHWRQTITTGAGVTINYFDALWRKRVSVTKAGAAVASASRADYDADNRVTFQSYPLATVPNYNGGVNGTATTYDALGRVLTTTIDTELSPAKQTATNSYLTNFQTQRTDFNGNTSVSSFEVYDQPSESALAALTGPQGLSLSINRDVFGKPTAVRKWGTNAGVTTDITRSYVYDTYQLLCKTIEPELGATLQDWDAAGNMLWRSGGTTLTGATTCDRASVTPAQKISFTYDLRNRLKDTTYGDASPSINRTYTDDGLLLTTASSGNTWTYGYNNRRLMTSESLAINNTNYDLAWGYDVNGHLSSLTYLTAGPTTYGPDALGRPTRIGTFATGITYHPNGAVKGYTYGNGVVHSLSQNVRGLPQVITDAGVVSDQYTYDQNANIKGITDLQESLSTRSMGYDGLNRLTTANGIWGTGTFAYDVQDNLRTSTVGARALTHNYNPPANNLLTSLSGSLNQSYGYDGNGNITNRGAQAFTFDLGNRMMAATGLSTYTYDGNGRRAFISNTDGTNHVQLYDRTGTLLVGKAGGTSPSTTKYFYLGSKLIAEVKLVAGVATNTYEHTDTLGSPVARTDINAALVSRTRFEPYGNVAAGYNPTRPDSIGYTGHVNDANTGLTYMQARYYDPLAGRLLSVDPIVADGNTGASFNRYEYANSNPYKYIDPTGQAAQSASTRCWWTADCSFYDSTGSGTWMTADGPIPRNITPEIFSNAQREGVEEGAFLILLPESFIFRIFGRSLTRVIPAAKGVASLPTKPSQLGHILRNASGHLPDTPANRQLLIDVANNAANRVGADRFGNVWSSVTRADGTQVWVSTRNGVIQNGGLNSVPQAFPNVIGP